MYSSRSVIKLVLVLKLSKKLYWQSNLKGALDSRMIKYGRIFYKFLVTIYKTLLHLVTHVRDSNWRLSFSTEQCRTTTKQTWNNCAIPPTSATTSHIHVGVIKANSPLFYITNIESTLKCTYMLHLLRHLRKSVALVSAVPCKYLSLL